MSRWIAQTAKPRAEARRQALKTASYAVMHLLVATGVAFALSGSWQVALGIGLIEPAVQTVAYVLHERAWARRERAAARASAPVAHGA